MPCSLRWPARISSTTLARSGYGDPAHSGPEPACGARRGRGGHGGRRLAVGSASAARNLEPGKDPKLIDGLTFDTDGKSFYLSCQAKAGVWHAEPLKRSYLEKDTTIAWKRPFAAKWIGRFFITSDEYDWPFYFVDKPRKIWGRYIRGWYQYPLRFDGDRTVVHFEKEFRPKGDLLIYCLEPQPDRPEASFLTPAEVVTRALGKQEADRILDPEGAVEKTLLAHRLAVCAMTNTMQTWFDKGQEGSPAGADRPLVRRRGGLHRHDPPPRPGLRGFRPRVDCGPARKGRGSRNWPQASPSCIAPWGRSARSPSGNCPRCPWRPCGNGRAT